MNGRRAGRSREPASRAQISTGSPVLLASTVWIIVAVLILASKSETRKALLQGAGLRFEASRVEIDERALEAKALGKGADAPGVARGLAEAKALQLSHERPEAVVIGADQVLAHRAELLHKPADMAEARRQPQRLRGESHHLHAGIALASGGKIVWSTVETAQLTMRTFTDVELDNVLALEGQAIFASVGAYRLEGPSIRLFERVEGDYFTILGLPLLPLLEALRRYAPQTLSQ